MEEDPYELRCEMAKMHNEFLEQLRESIQKRAYIEATWLCYAMFEQRTWRIIEKHAYLCPKEERKHKGKGIVISTKLKCLRKLCKLKYGPFSSFDAELIDLIDAWCDKRNKLTHGLISIEYYKKYSKEFEELAEIGYSLVSRLYDEATKIREWYRCEDNKLGTFPDVNCGCDKCCYFKKR